MVQVLRLTAENNRYPSGSAAVCAAIRDFVDALWPHLTLTMQGDEVSYSDAPFVILPNTAMATVPLTGAVNPAPGGLSAAAIAERCRVARELGGSAREITRGCPRLGAVRRASSAGACGSPRPFLSTVRCTTRSLAQAWT